MIYRLYMYKYKEFESFWISLFLWYLYLYNNNYNSNLMKVKTCVYRKPCCRMICSFSDILLFQEKS